MNKEDVILKKQALIARIEEMGSLLLAFSGGVDSSFLLALAHQVLGERVVAATATSLLFTARELDETVAFTRERGILHVVFPSGADLLPEVLQNTRERCFYCKRQLFIRLQEIAKEKGIPWIAHAANTDDLRDFRPGFRAAEEAGALAPLLDAGLSKEEIRFLSREMGLPTWNKPSMACLASRIPYGDPLTEEKLHMILEGEAFLRTLGFGQFRLRRHGPVARLEIEHGEMERVMEPGMREKIAGRLKELGFYHICLDLEGYISGSMNRGLEKENGEGGEA